MRTKTFLFLATALCGMAFVSCSSDDNNPEPVIDPVETRINLTAEQVAISNQLQTFSWQMLERLHSTSPTDNTLFSPLSVETELGMVLNGMKGTGKNELKALMNLMAYEGVSDEDINHFLQTMAKGIALETDNRTRFYSANSVWYDKTRTLNPQFESALNDYYAAEFYPVSFTSETANTINKWCSEKTNGLIPSIVNATSPEDLLYLINAVYFRSKWADKFDSTQRGVFTTATGTTESVDMMTKTFSEFGECSYAYGDTYRAAALHFSNKAYSMAFILPDEGRSIDEVLTDIIEHRLTRQEATNKIIVDVPKFEVSSDYQLEDILQSMGCTLFDRPESFDIFTTGNTAPNEMRHKAYLRIDEEGAEAAAVTDMGWATSPGPMPGETIHLTFNRPFLYAIVENSTGFPLFLGNIAHVNAQTH